MPLEACRRDITLEHVLSKRKDLQKRFTQHILRETRESLNMYQSMELERWLRKNNMETNELARLSGCTRQVIWKVKKNEPIVDETAQKIYFITGGQVKPVSRSKGRPRKGRSKMDSTMINTRELCEV